MTRSHGAIRGSEERWSLLGGVAVQLVLGVQSGRCRDPLSKGRDARSSVVEEALGRHGELLSRGGAPPAQPPSLSLSFTLCLPPSRFPLTCQLISEPLTLGGTPLQGDWGRGMSLGQVKVTETHLPLHRGQHGQPGPPALYRARPVSEPLASVSPSVSQ